MSKKLSDADVRAIRSSSDSGAALGARYGVSQATISRIKRRLARAEVEDRTMTEERETELAVEGGQIAPETPTEAATEAEDGDCPEGTTKVRCTVSNVHLGNNSKLMLGEVGCVPSDVADVLVEKGLAEAV